MSEWDYILPEKVYSPEEPDDSVVNFVDSLPRKKRRRVLDLACGAGRHVVFLAEQGFDANGVDVSETGLRLAQERLRGKKLKATLIRCDMRYLPYIGSCFNAVICTRAVYHQDLRGIQKTISGIRTVLKKGGRIFIDFLSKRTYSYGKGVRFEGNTFMETEGLEKGVLHHFVGEQELKRLFTDFEITGIVLKERMVKGRLRSRWLVTATI